MRKSGFLFTVFAVIAMVTLAFTVQPATAKNLGNGSDITDTLQVGEITGLGNKVITIKTKFEKNSKKYELHMLPEAYVMTAHRGKFMKFSQLKKGDLIAAYGWFKGGKWNARRVDLLDRNNYLIKRLKADAKAGVYLKHENVK